MVEVFFFSHLKAHKIVKQGVFSFIIFSQLRWLIKPKFSKACYFMLLWLDTLSEKTGLWHLSNVYSAFNRGRIIFDSLYNFAVRWFGRVALMTCNQPICLYTASADCWPIQCHENSFRLDRRRPFLACTTYYK